jgi:hypothetical protein
MLQGYFIKKGLLSLLSKTIIKVNFSLSLEFSYAVLKLVSNHLSLPHNSKPCLGHQTDLFFYQNDNYILWAGFVCWCILYKE